MATFNLSRNVQDLSVGDTVSGVACVIVNYGTDSNGTTLTKASPHIYDTSTAYLVGDKCTYSLVPYVCTAATSGAFDADCWTKIEGRIIEKTINIVTSGSVIQSIADDLLESSSSEYQPLTISGARLDPSAELGDQITVDGYSSIIGAKTLSGTPAAFADIQAPDIESEDDVVFKTKAEREADRNYQTIQSTLQVTANAVSAIVQEVGADGTVTAASIVAAINESGSTVKISADHVTISGYVTFYDLATSGTTTINGNNITTGTISAARIGTGTLRLGDSGRIVFDNSGMSDVIGYVGTSNFGISSANDIHIESSGAIQITSQDNSITMPMGTAGRYWQITNYGIFWMNSDGSVNKTVVLE